MSTDPTTLSELLQHGPSVAFASPQFRARQMLLFRLDIKCFHLSSQDLCFCSPLLLAWLNLSLTDTIGYEYWSRIFLLFSRIYCFSENPPESSLLQMPCWTPSPSDGRRRSSARFLFSSVHRLSRASEAQVTWLYSRGKTPIIHS